MSNSTGEQTKSFNGRLRDECLNTHWWNNLDEARQTLEDWRQDYNEMAFLTGRFGPRRVCGGPTGVNGGGQPQRGSAPQFLGQGRSRFE